MDVAGHGSQTQDRSGDESDGLNETLCPCDYKQVTLTSDPECLLLPPTCMRSLDHFSVSSGHDFWGNSLACHH